MHDDLQALWKKIKTQRDELVVQSHLAKSEFKDEWDKLEVKWQSAEKSLNKLETEAKEATEDIGQATKVVMDELSSAYNRIKDRLSDQD